MPSIQECAALDKELALAKVQIQLLKGSVANLHKRLDGIDSAIDSVKAAVFKSSIAAVAVLLFGKKALDFLPF